MLHDQIRDIDHGLKYAWLKEKISTILAQMADGALQTVAQGYLLDLNCETACQMQSKELPVDDIYRQKFVDDKKSWFTQMEVLDTIYTEFFFNGNRLGYMPTTSQYFQQLAPQTQVLVASAIHCAQSEYATGKMTTVMFC